MSHATTGLLDTLDSDLPFQGATDDLFAQPLLAHERDVGHIEIAGDRIPLVTQEFWTSGQRQASSLHEVSYRACFKPQLPRYFIRRFTNSEDVVYDPFSGRGTTAIEAALMGRRVIVNDVNPLSQILIEPRLSVPGKHDVEQRLLGISYERGRKATLDLSMFYHPETEAEIVSLKEYLRGRRDSCTEDDVDRWIRMVATNRLTGHSPGFFSVYTFPPNQAVSAESQVRINEKRHQQPIYRDTKKIILKKTVSLLASLSSLDIKHLRHAASSAIFVNSDARETKGIPLESVQLTVTSPPFLDIVQYAEDNWLRCWFNSIDVSETSKSITMARTIEAWSEVMSGVFRELYRITRPHGWVAFEVGEIRNGKIKLDEHVTPIGIDAGFDCKAILINSQVFTKTSNIWGVSNNKAGTNTNRIVLFRRP